MSESFSESITRRSAEKANAAFPSMATLEAIIAQQAAALASLTEERDRLRAKVTAAQRYITALRTYPQTITPELHAAGVAYYELTPGVKP